MDNVGITLAGLRARVDDACRRVGREPGEVTLIGAAKTVSAIRLSEFLGAGLADVGENYVQEGTTKIAEVARLQAAQPREPEALPKPDKAVRWHLIGGLQSNKARAAVGAFDLIHSVDRLSLARSVDRAARSIGKTQEVLLQVNMGEEAGKEGCAPHQLPGLLEACAGLPGLKVCGLMCLPPFHPQAERSRPWFRQLRRLQEQCAERSATQRSAAQCGGEVSGAFSMRHLSMGMTNDFEVAIEEGATLVRIGTGLFGARAA